MKRRRLFIIIGGTILVALFGGMGIFWLNNKCPNLSQSDCRLMWGTMLASILGGVLLMEILFARRKTQGKKQAQAQDSLSNQANSSNWYIWFRPVAWVTLSSLLAGLPLIVQGAFALTVSGTATGMFLDGLIRGFTNQLPVLEEDNKS